MSREALAGVPAAPGRGAGQIRRLKGSETASPAEIGSADEEVRRAADALAAAAAELTALAAGRRAGGDAEAAEIIAANALLCADPALLERVRQLVEGGADAGSAVAQATEDFATQIEQLPDELLSRRGADVRSVGRRAIGALAGPAPPARSADPSGGAVLVAEDLGPADVVELSGIAGVALSKGGPHAHAAIVARSLGIPMVTGLGPAIIAVPPRASLLVDGDAGTVLVDPPAVEVAELTRASRADVMSTGPDGPAATLDGVPVRVLVNATGAREVEVGSRAGAEGVGLLRTEVAFMAAAAWPTAAEHREALTPVFEAVPAGATCTVRMLDFGGDKTPPFLDPAGGRGIALQLAGAGAVRSQAEGILAAAEGLPIRVRVMAPLVESVDQVIAVKEAFPAAVEVGAMIETPTAVAAAPAIFSACDFASIGTNDLMHEILGHDRFAGGDAVAHHPLVLRAIAELVRAAAAARIPLEVCGEAASDPTALPLLLGCGIREVSVGAALVGAVRGWIAAAETAALERLARAALGCETSAAVVALVEAARSAERGDARAQLRDRGGRVGTIGAEGDR